MNPLQSSGTASESWGYDAWQCGVLAGCEMERGDNDRKRKREEIRMKERRGGREEGGRQRESRVERERGREGGREKERERERREMR